MRRTRASLFVRFGKLTRLASVAALLTTALLVVEAGASYAATTTITVTPSSLSFPSQPLGMTSDTQTVTVTNTGVAPLVLGSGSPCCGNPQESGSNANNFSVTNNGCDSGTIPVGQFCTFDVSFTPSSVHPEDAYLHFYANDPGSPQYIPLTGTGVATKVSITPSRLTFPHEGLHLTSAPQRIKVTNVGSKPLLLGYNSPCCGNPQVVGANSSDFSVQQDGCDSGVIPVGQFCTFKVTFTPSTTTGEDADLLFYSNATGSPQFIPLAGTGAAATIGLSRSSIAFSSQPQGTTSGPVTVVVTNSGTNPVLLGDGSPCCGNPQVIGANAGDFVITSNGCDGGTIPVGLFCTFDVSFSPSTPNPEDATIEFYFNSDVSPATIPVTGGTQAVPSVSAVAPRDGPQSGGTYTSIGGVDPQGTVEILGSGFVKVTGLTFGGVAATTYSVVSSTEILAVPPPHAANDGVFVVVATDGGASTTSCTTTVAGEPVIQSSCNDSFFYMARSSKSATLNVSSLNGKTFSATPTSGSDGASKGVAHECGYTSPPSPGASFTASVKFSVPAGTTFTGAVSLDQAQDASVPAAFVGAMSLALSHPVKMTVSLSGAYGDCIDIQTPLTLFDLLGVDVVIEPSISGAVDYSFTIAAGHYRVGGIGYLNGQLQKPTLTLNCAGTTKCLSGSAPSFDVQASLIAGLMLRLGPAVGRTGAYIEAGPAVGLAYKPGSAGFRESCGGGIWDGHVNVPIFGFGIGVGANGLLTQVQQLGGSGLNYASQCPL